MTNNLNILVISDLHSISDTQDEGDSHLLFQDGESIFGNNFIEYVKSLNQKIDLLICAGDLANSGSKSNFELGWKFLNKIKSELSIKELLCVPGNHDHQSRPDSNEHNPKEFMQYTTPNFPLNCFEKNTFFWAWNWCHIENKAPEYNAFLVNTSATHGYGKEYKHGRMPHQATDRLADLVNSSSFPKKPINILICHHHPNKMEHVDNTSDYEAMDGGDYLLRKLGGLNKGPWLIIHGHKHFADVCYAQSPTRQPPVIFSAGSLSARLYTEIQDRTSNQFYLIEIDLAKSEQEGLATGTFNAYEFMLGRSWSRSNAANLPATGGFGSKTTINNIATKIINKITDECPFINQFELSEMEDEIKHLTPFEFKQLLEKLEESGHIVEVELGSIVEVGRHV